MRNCVWPILLGLWLFLTPLTIIGSVILALHTASFFILRSGLEYHRSQQPDETAALFAFLITTPAMPILLVVFFWRWVMRETPSFLRLLTMLTLSHLLVAVAAAACAQAIAFW